MQTLTVAVTDQDGTVLDTFEVERREEAASDLAAARVAVLDAATEIRLGL